MKKSLKKTNRLIFFELLRFISAISILIWHYQHFFFNSNVAYNLEKLPLFNFLELFYKIGGSGVVIFWCLSGYIFYYNYSKIITQNKINIKKFLYLRFSRLWPLHFLTLVFVAIAQVYYIKINNTYFVYQTNDLKHFFLQLFMASNWGFEDNYSFNGPIWSVSIEIIVYFLFFILIKNFNNSLLIPILAILFCALIKIYTNTTYLLLDCLIYFFTGGLAYFCTKITKKYQKKFNIYYFFLILTVPFFCFLFKLYNLKYFYFLFFLFYAPNLLIFLANLSINNQLINNWLSVMGNTTYSIYLMHFPIQIGIINVAIFFKINLPLYNWLFFLFYISFTIIASIFMYKYFEFPLMNLLRKIYR